MVDGFGSIGEKSSDLSPNNQCQKEWGYGYMLDNNETVQLSFCEFITSQSVSGMSSAKVYPSGDFLSGRYVKSAKIIGNTNIE